MRFSSRYGVLKNTKNRIINLSTAFVLAATGMSGALPLFLSQKAMAVTSTVVTPIDYQGWQVYKSTGQLSFTTDALQLSTPTGYVMIYRDAVTPVAVDTIDVSYDTQRVSGATHAAPSYVLGIDRDGNTADTSDEMYAWFEPAYNSGSNYNSWNTWHLNQTAQFWSMSSVGAKGGANGANLFTLADVKTAFPSAKVIDYTINMGSGNDGWSALVDNVVTPEATYDFASPTPGTTYVNYTADATHVIGYNNFTTVQTAVNAVGAGGTVNVAAGTYTGAINVTKSVSIVGAGAGSTVFNVTSGTTFGQGISVNGQDNVTISNMTFNTPAGTPVSYAFQAYQSTNVTLTNLIFNGPGKSATPRFGGVDFNSVSGITINNVTARNYSKNGFAFTSRYLVSDQLTQNVSLTNITADTNNWAGVAFYTVGNDHSTSPTPSIGGAGDINGVTFNGTNVVSNNTKGLEVVGDSDANVAAGTTPRWGITGASTSAVSLANVTFSGNGANVVSKQKYSLYQPQTTTSNVQVTIPAGTTVTPSDNTWDGIVHAPVAIDVSNLSVPGAPSGYSPVTAITVGSNTVSLTFDKAVKLVFPGQANNVVGFIKNGAFKEITHNCNEYLSNLDFNMPDGGDCKTNDVNGTDLVVWTKHFTTFVAYSKTQAPVTPPTPSSNNKRAVVASTSTTASAVDNAASVLGIASGTSSDATKTPATTNKSKDSTKDTSSNFLGLGWWWVAVLAAVAALGYLAVVRRADR